MGNDLQIEGRIVEFITKPGLIALLVILECVPHVFCCTTFIRHTRQTSSSRTKFRTPSNYIGPFDKDRRVFADASRPNDGQHCGSRSRLVEPCPTFSSGPRISDYPLLSAVLLPRRTALITDSVR